MGPIVCAHQPPGLWLRGLTLRAEALTHSWSPQSPPGLVFRRHKTSKESRALGFLCRANLMPLEGLRPSGGLGRCCVYCLIKVDVGSQSRGVALWLLSIAIPSGRAGCCVVVVLDAVWLARVGLGWPRLGQPMPPLLVVGCGYFGWCSTACLGLGWLCCGRPVPGGSAVRSRSSRPPCGRLVHGPVGCAAGSLCFAGRLLGHSHRGRRMVGLCGPRLLAPWPVNLAAVWSACLGLGWLRRGRPVPSHSAVALVGVPAGVRPAGR